MDVFEDEHRRPPRAELTNETSSDLKRSGDSLDEVRELAPGGLGDVENRAQRTWCPQWLTRAP